MLTDCSASEVGWFLHWARTDTRMGVGDWEDSIISSVDLIYRAAFLRSFSSRGIPCSTPRSSYLRNYRWMIFNFAIPAYVLR
jgi:hypothetical protein